MRGKRYKKQSLYSFIAPMSNNALYRFLCVFIVLALLVIMLSGIVIGKDIDKKSDLSETPTDPEHTDSTDPSDILGAITTVSKSNSEIGKGDLILVNYQYDCMLDGNDMISMLEATDYDYTISDYEVKMNSDVFRYADNLLGKFEEQNGGSSNLNVACAYRSRDLQEELYNDKIIADGQEEANKWIAKPGYSEHQTGMAFDLSIIIDGATYDYTGDGEYAWINENCHKYGFVVRYPVDKASITKIEHEPWHFRYVGVPHAEYMSENNLCLEEYIDLLHTKSINQPLIISADNNKYAVYYTSAQGGADLTQLSVPSSKEYTVSGDNIGGFITTVKL